MSSRDLLAPGVRKVESESKKTQNLAGFKKASRGFSVEARKPDSGAFSGRFGSDFGGLPGCNSDFCRHRI